MIYGNVGPADVIRQRGFPRLFAVRIKVLKV